MEFCPNKNYFDDIRNTTQDAINYVIQNQQELVDKALTQTEKIRVYRGTCDPYRRSGGVQDTQPRL